ncbi:hypothetical protein JF50_12665 [Pseudoalteromonas luteoviolacea]|uniref:Uncharacterized protein n=1 Tax=Pseudoalteromonas luteoviolacea TaxID=43657 RepID=A0A023Q0K9_9GAMM|nr:hypothetical protein [Pseudoalteromonas luteoviolacea]AHX39706.1 hypothetical protein [Pseudoalteromonas luteoviolacea]KID56756.1 hypothetical protein JF50_12665 [Pseudoalteromonas luteoviolacea]
MERKVNLKIACFGGAGIGLLFGVIMGTSVTPTVTMLLGALTAVLAAILGLNDRHFNDAKALRIGAFGVACVVGAYMGIYVRAHNVFTPSLLELKAQYLAAGYTHQQALQLLTLKEFGMTLEHVSSAEGASSSGSFHFSEHANLLSSQHNSVLFSASVSVTGCEELRYTDRSLELEEVINNFTLTGDEWATLSESIVRQVEPGDQKSILLAVRDTVCGELGDEKPCLDDRELANITEFDEAQHILSQAWHQTLQQLNEQRLSEVNKLHALKFVHEMVCPVKQG